MEEEGNDTEEEGWRPELKRFILFAISAKYTHYKIKFQQ
jgi:hypothetical protein